MALRSMTGYGRREAGGQGVQFAIEVRSLNNRYLDLQIKAPRSLAALEGRIKRTVQERFSRGRFDLFITRIGGQDAPGRLAVNEALAGQYVSALRDLKQRYALAGDVDLALLAGIPDIISVVETREDPEQLWQVLAAGLGQALEDLDRMRTDEGAVLVEDIRTRLDAIERLTGGIGEAAPASVELARKRMNDTLARLLNEPPDPVRVAQEIAILAERTDITEELTRLGSHLKQFRSLLANPPREGVGRKLDFLIQEIGREVNTIASKAMVAQISLDVVHIKSELEKVREQVQNIE